MVVALRPRSIDTDVALEAARTWTAHGDELDHQLITLERSAAALGVDASAATVAVAAASTTWWSAATILRTLTDRAVAADRVGRLDLLGASSVSPIHGDVGGTGELELRATIRPTGDDATARARHLLTQAFTDSGDARRIRADEFGLIQLADDRFVVVLPGVTDLRHPDLGWSDEHRSVRDLDQAAVASSRSTSVDANPYARSVADTLRSAGVPPGSNLLLVGHSFGADTALDLAGDPRFNGPTGFRVTHVVAAAYHSTPQLDVVPPDTAVLVLQNRRDAVVMAERVGAAHVTESVALRADALEELAALDPKGAARSIADLVRNDLAAAHDAVRLAWSQGSAVADLAVGVLGGDARVTATAITDLLAPPVGVTGEPGRLVDVFAGGSQDAGHAQIHYVRRLQSVEDPRVRSFLDDLDRSGYTGRGTVFAVDVSVPDPTNDGSGTTSGGEIA